LFSGYIAGQDNLTLEQQNALTDEATLISGLAGALFSEGDINNATLAGSVGGSAYQNNYLTHAEAAALQEELAACEQDELCDPYDIIEKYQDISRQNDVDLLSECGADFVCINARLQQVATSDDFATLIAEHPDLYGAIEGAVAPGVEVGERIADIVNGTPVNATAEDLYCGGVVGSECDAILEDMALESGMVVGGALLIGGVLTFVPEAAAACMANPICRNAYLAFEAAGTISDLEACAEGDVLSCAAAAVPVATTGGMGDDIADALTDGERVLDDVAEGVDVTKNVDELLSPTDVYKLDDAVAANKLPNEVSDVSGISFDANNPYVLNDVPLSAGSPSKGYADLGTHTVDLTDTVSNLDSLPSKTFYNNEGILPSQYGPYTEYQVPSGSTGSNRQRIVVGNEGTMFYTPDHYNTFIPLN
jgi:filamentous hemagglutinin